MFQVLLQVAGCADILHQEGATGFQGFVDTIEHTLGYGLIMYGVEGGDKVKAFGFGGVLKVAQVTCFKLNIGQPRFFSLPARLGQCVRRQVIAGKV